MWLIRVKLGPHYRIRRQRGGFKRLSPCRGSGLRVLTLSSTLLSLFLSLYHKYLPWFFLLPWFLIFKPSWLGTLPHWAQDGFTVLLSHKAKKLATRIPSHQVSLLDLFNFSSLVFLISFIYLRVTVKLALQLWCQLFFKVSKQQNKCAKYFAKKNDHALCISQILKNS